MTIIAIILGIIYFFSARLLGRWYQVKKLGQEVIGMPMSSAPVLIINLAFFASMIGFILITWSIYYALGIWVVGVIAHHLGASGYRQLAISQHAEYLMEQEGLDFKTAYQQAHNTIQMSENRPWRS